ncbi:phosphotransferase family protein [Halorussus ruber]|uniref:phosphotransferase family protein n=1 Tax=Halorussus ruber TaxID=1126238 RepID=UPI0010927DEF|nr:phosphotransferase family protein [Halorussus ruber]
MTETTSSLEGSNLETPELESSLSKLGSYLSAELGADVTEIEILEEGLNLIASISTAEDERYILRQPNKLRDAGYMIGIEREWEVMRRLDATELPTPEPVVFCDDESILGDPFFVMTRLDGETVPLGSDLPERFRSPDSREQFANCLVDTLAAMHSLDAEPFAGLLERKPPREKVARASDRLDEATNVTGREFTRLRSVGDWLRENALADSNTTLVHGDFRPGNLLFAETDRPQINGVLDWESALLGDPLTGLGYLLLRWRDEGDPTPSLDRLEAEYSNEEELRHLREVNQHGLAPFTSRPGSPTRRELIARYEEQTGFSFENGQFYVALAAYLLATVWADLYREQVESRKEAASGEDGAETASEAESETKSEAESDRLPHIDYVTTLAESVVSGAFEV